mmetsp:Transcript_15929/g.25839  ORF Transcript_15929/g.25839 Transcript_15929/m.25839 type:complete len:101 (+) Transcript_15929:64-366(+)
MASTTTSSSSVLWKWTGRTAASLMGGTTLYGTYKYQTDQGSRRAMEAYKTFVPVILHYRFLQAQQRWLGAVDDQDWKALDELYAKPTVDKLAELQGMYTK